MSDLEGFKSLGPAGAFISLMVTAILALSAAVGVQWRQSNKVYGYRLGERDTLKDALNGNTKALADQTRSAEERNRIIEELADAIDELAQSVARMNERQQMVSDAAKDQRRDEIEAFKQMAEAVRTNTAMVTDVRNRVLYPTSHQAHMLPHGGQ